MAVRGSNPLIIEAMPALHRRDLMIQETCTDLCSVNISAVGANSLVEIAGEVDISTVTVLAKAIHEAVNDWDGDIILEAQGLIYIDSTGLRTLLSAQQKIETQQRRMAVVGCHGIFQKLLRTSGLDTRFRMYSTLDEALMDLEDWDAPTA
jgi:anti-sigma B factor antagonist